MLKRQWLLCCAAALTLAGCSLMAPDRRPRHASASASACPEYSMEYCVIDNYGKRCRCASKQSVDVMVRSHQ